MLKIVIINMIENKGNIRIKTVFKNIEGKTI